MCGWALRTNKLKWWSHISFMMTCLWSFLSMAAKTKQKKKKKKWGNAEKNDFFFLVFFFSSFKHCFFVFPFTFGGTLWNIRKWQKRKKKKKKEKGDMPQSLQVREQKWFLSEIPSGWKFDIPAWQNKNNSYIYWIWFFFFSVLHDVKSEGWRGSSTMSV